jgi:hypothetical protein
VVGVPPPDFSKKLYSILDCNDRQTPGACPGMAISAQRKPSRSPAQHHVAQKVPRKTQAQRRIYCYGDAAAEIMSPAETRRLLDAARTGLRNACWGSQVSRLYLVERSAACSARPPSDGTSLPPNTPMLFSVRANRTRDRRQRQHATGPRQRHRPQRSEAASQHRQRLPQGCARRRHGGNARAALPAVLQGHWRSRADS